MLDKRILASLEQEVSDNLSTPQMRLMKKFLEMQYELVKEQMVDDSSAELQGEARGLRKLIKKLTVRDIVEESETLSYSTDNM